MATVEDSATGIKTTYYYDFTDRLMKYVETGEGYSHSVGYAYDDINNLTSIVETINGVEHTTSYAYDLDNRVTSVTSGAASEHYTYDAYGRVSQQETKSEDTTVLTETFAYKAPTAATTSSQIKTHTITSAGYSPTFNYTYDGNGNITAISGGISVTYVYDSANQLVRENNQSSGKTTTWEYDKGGNIVSRKEYAYTTGNLGTPVTTVTYTYGGTDAWRDLLIEYDGNAITYDENGNMTSNGTVTYTWEHGRQLSSAMGWTFEYSADGLRTKRVNSGGKTYAYVYSDGKLTQMTVSGKTLYFTYDASGTPQTVTLDGVIYYYVTNIQGDVIAILNSSGAKVGQYLYDAWGNILYRNGSNLVSQLNPLLYRGYVYDIETGLYYLQSRYYDPEMGRFINADDPEVLFKEQDSPIQYNLFAYGLNSPVNVHDPDGYAAANIIGGIVGGVVGAALGYLLAQKLGLTGWKKAALVAAATVGGAVLGAFLGPYVAKLAKSIGSAVKTTVKTVAKQAPKSLCFVAGTLVESQYGHIPIETVEIGDYVYAEDPETGEKGLKKVIQTFTNEVSELVHVTVNNETIVTTPGHPFYVAKKGWIGADKLKIGDTLVTYKGDRLIVEHVEIEVLSIPVEVYNFEVEDFHTYFVGENSVLVHNKGCGLNKLADSYLKKHLKLNAHAIKKEYLGNKAKIALYDLAVDKSTGIIYIVDKAGKIIAETIYRTK